MGQRLGGHKRIRLPLKSSGFRCAVHLRSPRAVAGRGGHAQASLAGRGAMGFCGRAVARPLHSELAGTVSVFAQGLGARPACLMGPAGPGASAGRPQPDPVRGAARHRGRERLSPASARACSSSPGAH
ncbi:hypothetical protein J2X68_007709 [Streptomyces sp. 3330]|nr:hypothetical protein [Streptomyces sp. 3330]